MRIIHTYVHTGRGANELPASELSTEHLLDHGPNLTRNARLSR